uniref:Uncharacterized protein n=1 Tax=Sinocyclocheilus rhinocerous TaxID=307959 RepID=A0A673M636_9TELE
MAANFAHCCCCSLLKSLFFYDTKFSGTMSWVTNDPPFHHMLRASGQAEVWNDFADEAKFRQYGWRCSTNEDSYSNATLIGNWSEERVDTRRTVALRRPLPHQVSQYQTNNSQITLNLLLLTVLPLL